jgi:PAS domain S-box-containing protein
MRQTEKELRRKQDEMIAVINNIPDLVWLKNRALQYALINSPLKIFSGITSEEVSGSSDIACHPVDMRDVYLKRDMDVIRTGTMARNEEVLVNCKGQKHIVDCVRMPIADESGAVVGVVGICHDITAQKLREEELQVKLDTMVQTFEEKSDELITINAEMKMRKSELDKERAELESTRQQVQENRNALSILARNMENMHWETEHQILMETRKILTPIIQRLKNNKGLDHGKDDINLLASYLEDQTSRFSHNTRIIFSLSPAELQIASMIKNGMSSEEIAAHLHVSVNTIKTHRKNIRRKLGLQNSSINLTSHLKSHLS